MKKSYLFASVCLSATIGLAAMAPAASVFIPEGNAGQVLEVDAATGATIRTIPGLPAVHGLGGADGVPYLVAGSFAEVTRDEAKAAAKPEGVSAADHEKHHAAPAAGAMPKDAGLSLLSIIDAASGKVVNRIEVPGAVHHTGVSPDGKYAVATHPGEGGISIVDLETMTFRQFVATGDMPNYTVFSPDSATLYVTNAGNGTISVIDMARGIVMRNILAGDAPEHVVITADGARLFVADANVGVAAEVDIASGQTTRTFDIGGEIHGIGLSPDEKTLFVAAKEKNQVVSIDLATGTQKRAALGPNPYHLAVIPESGALYISSRGAPKVWRVDPATLTAVGEIAIKGVGHQMVVRP